jgi:hypothetical protein
MSDIDHRRLARELDRRRMRRRMLVLVTLLAAAIAALVYLRCGGGWGTGGKGPGEGGTTTTTATTDAATRCMVRLTATGLTVDGKSMTRDEAIAACKDKAGADVLITGDSRQGDWDELRGALEAASIPFFTREPRGVTPSDAAPPPPPSD